MLNKLRILLALSTLFSLNAISAGHTIQEGETVTEYLLRTNNFDLPKSYEGDPALERINRRALTADMFKPSIYLAIVKKRAKNFTDGTPHPLFGDNNIFFSGSSYFPLDSETVQNFLKAGGKELYAPEQKCFLFFPGRPVLSLKSEVIQAIRSEYYTNDGEL